MDEAYEEKGPSLSFVASVVTFVSWVIFVTFERVVFVFVTARYTHRACS